MPEPALMVDPRTSSSASTTDRNAAAVSVAKLKSRVGSSDPSEMVLAPAARSDWPVTRSTSGLMVGQRGDRLRVLHVMRGSPAAADWQAGMEICAVDGSPIPAAYAASPLASWSTGAPGRVVRLRLCDGTERSLTLARFY